MKYLLNSWKNLNRELLSLSEADVEKLIDLELKENKRATVLLRLYGRFNKLRTEREKTELLKGMRTWQ